MIALGSILINDEKSAIESPATHDRFQNPLNLPYGSMSFTLEVPFEIESQL